MFTVFVISCEQEASIEVDTSEIENYHLGELQKDRIFKGVFTTYDSEYRAVIQINFPNKKGLLHPVNERELPVAHISFQTGTDLILPASEYKYTEYGRIRFIFYSDMMQFELQIGEDGSEPAVNNAVFNNNAGVMLLAEHTTNNPVVAVTGTYVCTTCNGHPNVNNSLTQTFNMMFSYNNGTGTITTQSVIGSTTYTGIGYQSSCIVNNGYYNCTIESGDGTTTTTGYLAAGNPVTWTGTHESTYISTSASDQCNEVSGTWQWPSNSYGVLSGTFQSDDTCP
jgi:hypothetical protein